MARCSSCGAEVIWVTMAKTGKQNPVDAVPEKRIVLGGDGAAVVDTYVSHFATCPNAAKHRAAADAKRGRPCTADDVRREPLPTPAPPRPAAGGGS
jgi:hypothetical protein